MRTAKVVLRETGTSEDLKHCEHHLDRHVQAAKVTTHFMGGVGSGGK